MDVGLERAGERIACEVTVTTTEEHELQNIEKCLIAGYAKIVVCSVDKKRLDKIHKLASGRMPPANLTKVSFFSPEELFVFLDQGVAQPAGTEGLVKGYRVKVEYGNVRNAEQQNKKDAVAQVILQSLRRMKGK